MSLQPLASAALKGMGRIWIHPLAPHTMQLLLPGRCRSNATRHTDHEGTVDNDANNDDVSNDITRRRDEAL